MLKKINIGIIVLLLCILAVPAYAAQVPYEYHGKYYYVVDGNNPNLNSGDRVCASIGQKCLGYTAHTTDICKFIHPTASVNDASVNGSSVGFYCNGAPQGYAACANAINNCQICPTCNENVNCQTQIGDQFAEMYVECSGTPTSTVTVISGATTTPPSGGWWAALVAFWQHIWLSLLQITPWGAPTGANSGPQTNNSANTNKNGSVTGTKLPGEICANGGECKSGNCVRDDQGVYRCSCSPLGNDYSSCH